MRASNCGFAALKLLGESIKLSLVPLSHIPFKPNLKDGAFQIDFVLVIVDDLLHKKTLVHKFVYQQENSWPGGAAIYCTVEKERRVHSRGTEQGRQLPLDAAGPGDHQQGQGAGTTDALALSEKGPQEQSLRAFFALFSKNRVQHLHGNGA